ncbi:6-phosphofructokinase [Candidatus Caldatribacterium sp. SIUC1]|uniref:6-phosphofructokinase n=1 Tax=Candidatus Caldatribacterium sp. SIUC1 TaxID=3418365 RepID=UPI003F692262
MRQRIGVLSGGGDCPGINAVIHAVVKRAILKYDYEVIGILDGFEGLVEGRFRELRYNDVSGILPLGGTILGTSNRANPFRYPVRQKDEVTFEDRSRDVLRHFTELGLSALITIGGDGTFHIAAELSRLGIPVVGVPKTIDNDLNATDITFGFDSAVHVVTEAIDRLHTTAQSHHRVMVIEVMGRYAGWIALHGGIAGGGDVILIPEIPFDIEGVCEFILERRKRGKRFSIVVVAEGARPRGGDLVVQRIVRESHDQIRLGGVSHIVGRAIEEKTGLETRVVILGHLQRGGSPTAFDRVLATRLGAWAVDLVAQGQFGYFPAVRGQDIVPARIEEAIACLKTVPLDSPLLDIARSMGTYLGA